MSAASNFLGMPTSDIKYRISISIFRPFRTTLRLLDGIPMTMAMTVETVESVGSRISLSSPEHELVD